LKLFGAVKNSDKFSPASATIIVKDNEHWQPLKS